MAEMIQRPDWLQALAIALSAISSTWESHEGHRGFPRHQGSRNIGFRFGQRNE